MHHRIFYLSISLFQHDNCQNKFDRNNELCRAFIKTLMKTWSHLFLRGKFFSEIARLNFVFERMNITNINTKKVSKRLVLTSIKMVYLIHLTEFSLQSKILNYIYICMQQVHKQSYLMCIFLIQNMAFFMTCKMAIKYSFDWLQVPFFIFLIHIHMQVRR